MLKLSSLWRPNGFTREALESCKDNIGAYNAQSFSIISLLSAILLSTLGLLTFLIEKNSEPPPESSPLFKFILFLASAVLVLALYFFSAHFNKRKKHSTALFYGLYTGYFVLLMSLGLYLGVLRSPEQHEVLPLLFLLFSQALFVVQFHFSVALNLVTAIVFTIFILVTKSPLVREIETVNVWFAVILAFALNRYLMQVVIREMLASKRLEIERDRFREESIKDELTGLSNRREYQSAAKFYISVCQHVHQTICGIMLDVDFFKNYNDFYGHQKGDEALQAIGVVLKKLIVEEQVFAARVGGEEFFVLWTENRIAEAERVAIKIRHMISDLKIPHERSTAAPHVTVSLGLYMLRGGSQDTADDLYREADDALYEAKARGRNCIMLRDSQDRSLRMVEILPPEKNVGRRHGR